MRSTAASSSSGCTLPPFGYDFTELNPVALFGAGSASRKTQRRTKLLGLTDVEDGEQTMNPPYLFLSIAAVSVCSFTAVVIWVKERRREREAYYNSETAKKIAELQGPNVNAAVEFFRDAERNVALRRLEGLKVGGLLAIAVGLGMGILLRVADRNDPDPDFLIGIIPLLVGVALLIYVYMLAPTRK